MNEITIDGLTKEQVKLLDIMWAIDGYDDYMTWKSNLSEGDLAMVQLLEEMLLLADLDVVEDVTEAKTVLAKFMGNV